MNPSKEEIDAISSIFGLLIAIYFLGLIEFYDRLVDRIFYFEILLMILIAYSIIYVTAGYWILDWLEHLKFRLR